jgi:hypothetical protein
MRVARACPNRISMFSWIVTTFWMLLGRAGPRDLTCSQSVLVQAAVVYTLVSIADAALVFQRPTAILFGFADLGYTSAAIALCLGIRRRFHRLPQTLLAMLGVGSWLTLPSILTNGWIQLTQVADHPVTAPLGLQLLLAGVLASSILIVGRIFRDALDVDLFTGITVSMTYFLLNYCLLIAIPSRLFT